MKFNFFSKVYIYRFIKFLAVCLIVLPGMMTTNLVTANPAKAPAEAVHPVVQNKVNFWKKVFTEHTDEYTLIHDEEHPQIVYDVIEHIGMNNKGRMAKTRKALRSVRHMLDNLIKHGKAGVKTSQLKYYRAIPKILRNRSHYKAMRKSVRYQQGMSNRVRDGIARSLQYMPQIRKIFAEEGVPLKLAYLPHVESSFNNKAYSKVGAAGIWQFMPKTAKGYGLKVTKSVDERMDPAKATRAAAKLLKDNIRILKRWPLAITAYNHGPTSLNRAVKKLGTYELSDIIQDYDARSFSFASKNFYASFVAASYVAENHEKYFPNLEPSSTEELVTISLKKRTRAKTLLAKLGMSRKEFREFNRSVNFRALRRNYWIPKGTLIRYPKSLDRAEVVSL